MGSQASVPDAVLFSEPDPVHAPGPARRYRPLVWLPERVLNATVRGMYRSLTDSSVRRSGTRDLSGPWSRFVTFARRFDPQHFYDIMTHLLEDRHFSAAEAELIRKNLALHCARIGQILAQY